MWLLIAAATVTYDQQTDTHTHTFTLCNERREKETGETTTLREYVIRYSNSYTDYRKILTENRVQHYETEIVSMNRAKQPRLSDRED